MNLYSFSYNFQIYFFDIQSLDFSKSSVQSNPKTSTCWENCTLDGIACYCLLFSPILRQKHYLKYKNISLAPHSPRRQKLNLRMKSLSLDSPESTEHAQRRKHHGVNTASDPHSNQSSSSRIQCMKSLIFVFD